MTPRIADCSSLLHGDGDRAAHDKEREAVRNYEWQVVASDAVRDPQAEADHQYGEVADRDSCRGLAPADLSDLQDRRERHDDRPRGCCEAKRSRNHRASFVMVTRSDRAALAPEKGAGGGALARPIAG